MYMVSNTPTPKAMWLVIVSPLVHQTPSPQNTSKSLETEKATLCHIKVSKNMTEVPLGKTLLLYH